MSDIYKLLSVVIGGRCLQAESSEGRGSVRGGEGEGRTENMFHTLEIIEEIPVYRFVWVLIDRRADSWYGLLACVNKLPRASECVHSTKQHSLSCLSSSSSSFVALF